MGELQEVKGSALESKEAHDSSKKGRVRSPFAGQREEYPDLLNLRKGVKGGMFSRSR